ncbi:MAG: MarR family transcriptional regulator [Flavobacteriales bacterium]|nr:MarR family transcriptional regulator [Flavobacteriales bacterium]PCH86066.1 MAG: MarR family transcriptional regulator [Flavobacteriales bacterium]
MKPEDTIDFHIRWAWHGIARMYNIEAAKYDTTMSVGQTLLNIDVEGTPSTKLGPKMGMESRSLTRILKSMEEKGLIYKKADAKDKRMVRIYLTDFGREKREVSKEAVIKLNAAIHENIGKTNLQTFFKVIKKINLLLDSEAFSKNGTETKSTK